MSQCKNCGIELSQDTRFCSRCGSLNEDVFAPEAGMAAAPIKTQEYNSQDTVAPAYAARPQAASYTAPTQSASYTALTQSASYTAPTQAASYTAPTQSASYTAPTQQITINNTAQSHPSEIVNTGGILAWSIITLLCCNVGAVLGIFAVVFSVIAGVEKNYQPAKAKKYIYYAKIFNIVGLIIGIIVAILYVTIAQAFIDILNGIVPVE